MESLKKVESWQSDVLEIVRNHLERRVGYALAPQNDTGRTSGNELVFAQVGPEVYDTIFLQLGCFENPFDPDGPPLACFSIQCTPKNITRAVMTRSQDVITNTIDEMLAQRSESLSEEGE